jgi:hypothetical protein
MFIGVGSVKGCCRYDNEYFDFVKETKNLLKP